MRQKSILVVDDDPSIRKLVKANLEMPSRGELLSRVVEIPSSVRIELNHNRDLFRTYRFATKTIDKSLSFQYQSH